MLGGGRRAVIVTDQGPLDGLVSLSDVKHVPVERWASTPVRAVMTPAARLVVVSSETSIQDALARLAEADVNQLPVVDDGRLVGLLSRGDVIAYLRGREALDHARSRGESEPGAPGSGDWAGRP